MIVSATIHRIEVAKAGESQAFLIYAVTVPRKLAEGFIPWFSRHWDDGQCSVSLLSCDPKAANREGLPLKEIDRVPHFWPILPVVGFFAHRWTAQQWWIDKESGIAGLNFQRPGYRRESGGTRLFAR
jgi:hypothetical protein